MDEVRATAEQRLMQYQNLMVKHYNSNVRHRDFQVGDLMLRKVMGATKDPSQGKLGPNWEGPYRISSWQRKGTTTSRCWMDRKFSTHGTRSTFGNTTGRDNVKDDDEPPISQFI